MRGTCLRRDYILTGKTNALGEADVDKRFIFIRNNLFIVYFDIIYALSGSKFY